MGRHKQFERDQVLNEAMRLFWEKGYHDAVQCRRYYERVPRLGRRAGDGHGRAYRAGYRAAYTSAYRSGYTTGRLGDRTCWAPGRYR